MHETRLARSVLGTRGDNSKELKWVRQLLISRDEGDQEIAELHAPLFPDPGCFSPFFVLGDGLIRQGTPSRVPLFLAVATKACPGHDSQPGFSDGTFADVTDAKSTMRDSSQGLFDYSQEMTIRFVQV